MLFFEDLPPKPKAPTPPPRRLILPTPPVGGWRPRTQQKTTLKDLPMEILIKIAKYLNSSDINAMSLTCKRFLELSKHQQFMDRKVLNLHKIDFVDDKPPISLFKDSFRYFPSVTLYLVRFMDNNVFWKIFGHFIKDLQLRMCIIKKIKFLQILFYCPNLESLSIHNFDELLSTWDLEQKEKVQPMLLRLRVLRIKNVQNLNPQIFDFITDMMPNLAHLEITDCFALAGAVNRVRIIDHIFYFCAVRAPFIDTLDISGTPVDDIAMKKFGSIEGLQLKSFAMTFMGKITDDGIQLIIRSQTSLTHLNLSGSVGLVDEGLILICMKMPNIRVLNIRQCVMLTCRGFSALKDLRHLSVLDVTECERIKDEGFIEGLTGGNWSDWKEHLRELYMSSLSTLSETPTVRIAERFHQLSVLDLSGSSNCMSDYCLQLINRYLIMLQTLNLDGCGKISDVGFTGIGFVDEYADRYSSSRSKCLRTTRKHGYSISRLSQLRSLKMSGCYHVSDKALQQFRFNELKELVIGRCYQITLDGIRAISTQCPGIEVLDITECKNMTDKCIETLAIRLRRLKTLKMICCTELTNDSLHSLACHCKMIRNLYIRGCEGITANAEHVLYNVSSLRNIYAN